MKKRLISDSALPFREGLRLTITGTPGVGKTTVAEKVASLIPLKLFEISKLVKERRLYSSFDKRRDSYVVDVKKLRSFFENEKEFLAEGVVAHYIPSDILVILRLNPAELERRLRERGYSEEKVIENVEAERLAVIATEAFENPPSPRILHINATGKSPEELANLIIRGIKGEEIFDEVDWLEDEISRD